MVSRISIAGLTAVAFALGVNAQPAAAPPAVQEVTPAPAKVLEAPAVLAPALVPGQAVLKLEQLTKEQFVALPDSQVIEVQGQRTTKREFLAAMEQERNAALAKLKAAAGQAQATFEAARSQFLQRQQAELDAQNAKVRAEFASRRTQRGGPARSAAHQAIHKEASQLLERAKTAPPAEQEQIEQRAGELLKQLQQVPR